MARFLSLMGMFLVWGMAPVWGQPVPPDSGTEAPVVGPNGLIAHVNVAMSQRKYRAALEAVEHFLKEFPDDPRAGDMIQKRAICQVKTGSPEEAVPILEEMLNAAIATDDRAEQAQLHVLLGEAKAASEELRFVAAEHLRFGGAIYDVLDQTGEINAYNAWSMEADLYARYPDWRNADDRDAGSTENLGEVRLSRIVEALDRILILNVDDEIRQSTLQRMAYAVRVNRPNDEETADRMLECFNELIDIDDRSNIAGEALLESAALLVEHKRDYVAAARHYSRLLNFFQNVSKERRVQDLLDRIVQPSFTLKTDRPFAPSERIALDWEARNVDSVALTAYRVELHALMREIGHPDHLTKWKPPDQPIHHWTVELPNPGEYRPMVSGTSGWEPISFPVNEPGAYVVVARSGLVVAKRLVIVSRLAAVVKNGSQGTLVFVADRRSGQPVADAEILFQNRSGVHGIEYANGNTDEHGMCRLELSSPAPQRQTSRTGTAIVRSGDDYAVVSHGFFWRRSGYKGTHRVYGLTDRPTYLPGQRVHFKQTVRTASRDMYGNWAGRDLAVTIADPAGNVIHQADLTTNRQGSASGMFTLSEKAMPGRYAITSKIGRNVFGPKESPGNRFDVVGPDKVAGKEDPETEPTGIDPPVPAGQLSIQLDRSSYLPGETASVRIASIFKTADVLVTVESDRIHFARRLNVENGQAAVEIPIEHDFAPNVFIKAAAVRDGDTHESVAEIIVPKTREFLSVEWTIDPASLAPGGKAKLRMATKDANGKGRPAEVTLIMVDAALSETVPAYRTAIQDFFHGDLRPLLVQTHQRYLYFTGGLLPMASIGRPQSAKRDASPLDEPAPAGIDESLVETGLWEPSVVTNEEGVAEIEIHWPKRAATWRLTIIAIDHHGRAGETSTDVVVR